MPIILENVSFTYMKDTPFEKTALHDISLKINKGEFVAVIGHTGSGKSTLVQHLSGLLHPHTGTVTVDGVNLNAKNADAKKRAIQSAWFFSIRSIRFLPKLYMRILPLARVIKDFYLTMLTAPCVMPWLL